MHASLLASPLLVSWICSRASRISLYLAIIADNVSTLAVQRWLIKPIATKSISSATPKPCKFYMQGHCRYGKKGIGCSYPHPQMCFRFIKSGHKGCSKGDSCKYAHPKLCRSSLLSHKCDRIKCYFYHVTGTVRSNLNQNLLRTNVPKRPASHPTPLMNIKLPPSHPEATAQIARLRRTMVAYRWLNTGKVVRCLQRLSNQGPSLYIGAPSRGADRIRVHHLAKLISTTFFVSIHTCLMDNIFYYVSPFSVSVSISVR